SFRSKRTDVTSVRFDLKDRAEIEREALRLAVADAKSRAEAAAAGAGLAVDEIRRIEQSGGAYEPRPIMMRDMAVAASAGAPPPPETPINAGEIEVRAQVRLTASLH
ncbi:MAG: SIMPL domain-containing protein, partial [Deltaproteobacteria bacterium]